MSYSHITSQVKPARHKPADSDRRQSRIGRAIYDSMPRKPAVTAMSRLPNPGPCSLELSELLQELINVQCRSEQTQQKQYYDPQGPVAIFPILIPPQETRHT